MSRRRPAVPTARAACRARSKRSGLGLAVLSLHPPPLPPAGSKESPGRVARRRGDCGRPAACRALSPFPDDGPGGFLLVLGFFPALHGPLTFTGHTERFGPIHFSLASGRENRGQEGTRAARPRLWGIAAASPAGHAWHHRLPGSFPRSPSRNDSADGDSHVRGRARQGRDPRGQPQRGQRHPLPRSRHARRRGPLPRPPCRPRVSRPRGNDGSVGRRVLFRVPALCVSSCSP